MDEGEGKVARGPGESATAVQAQEPQPPTGVSGTSAKHRPVRSAMAAAVKRATSEAALSEAEGEDELDAFPLPTEARMEELREIEEATAGTDGDAGQASTAVATTVATAPVEPVDPAIKRFHQEIGLLPKDEPEPVPDIAVVPPGGDGGGSGDGGDTPGDEPGGNGRRGRRRLVDIEDRPMTIFEHLDELRRRLVWAGLAFIVGTGITLPFIIRILSWSMNNKVQQLLVTGPLEPMVAGVKLAILGGFVLGSPVILYQAIAYVLPALTRRERRLLFTYLPAALVLFAAGISFGVLVFEPLALRMAKDFLPSWVINYQPTLTNWINYLITFSVPFGLLFELPVVVSILVKLGIVAPQTLAAGRRWAFLTAIIIAVMFAPPLDFIVTPTIVALPLYGLYELSIFVARIAYRQRLRELPPE